MRRFLFSGVALFLLIDIPFFSRLFRQSFEDFSTALFQHELEGDTLNLHYTLTDPEAFGIHEETASLGNFSEEAWGAESAYLKDCQQQLSDYMEEGLDEDERLTAEILDWWLDGQLEMEDFYYYQEPLGPTLGIQAQLPVLLAEFPFRKQDDIDTYLSLLEALPDYFGQIGDFEQEKAKKGLFMNDEILDKILAQCTSLMTIDDSHILVATFRERLSGCGFLDENQRISYETKNLRCLKDCFQDAYQKLARTLKKLRGSCVNQQGLCYTPLGAAYYEHLLRYTVGTGRTSSEIRGMLEQQMEDDYETILYAIHQGADLLEAADSAPSIRRPEELLSDLEQQILTDFPEPEAISWQVKEIPDSLADYLSPAFYMTPSIDAPQQNTIYINPSYEPNRTELITTLAHEGYPGHLYQNSFERFNGSGLIRSLIYIGGYTEGWGLYSELYAYSFLGLEPLEASALQALSSINYAICAILDLSIHQEGWSEEDCRNYLSSFGITDPEQVHRLYLNILEEPANYLKYYLGYLEICNLKESAMALSSGLSARGFHEWLLEIGPAPFPILKERLSSLEVDPDLLQRSSQHIELLLIQPFHDGPYHPLMESRMASIGVAALIRQREQDDPFILGTACPENIAFLYQVVDRGGQGAHRHGHLPRDR